jgi:hypothetical protein
MATLQLQPFGIPCDVEVHGTVQESWSEGKRLLFLFGENHRDREMKRLNVVNACRLVDAGVVGCVGTEVPMEDLDRHIQEFIQERSAALFGEHGTDEGVINHLSSAQPMWFGFFQFGNTLRILRPSLPVRCVEDPTLREQMKPISDRYTVWDLCGGVHPFLGYPNMEDHPINADREAAIIRHLMALWDEKAPQARGAILNTGLAHSLRLCALARGMGVSYIYISIPVSDQTFGMAGVPSAPAPPPSNPPDP